jgi:hypothetical protein
VSARKLLERTIAVKPQQAPEAPRVAGAKPLVFISHDARDADLAEEFAKLLSDVSAGTLKTFRSSDNKGTSGIPFGADWRQAIMSKLGDATAVVALLTHHSVDRPWILYETGVATSKLKSEVIGVALGVQFDRLSTGPFGHFQNCADDEDQLTKLVMQLVAQNPDASPREEAVRALVGEFRSNVAKLLKERAKTASSPPQPEAREAAIARLFEELKVMVGQLPEKIEDRVRATTKRGGLRRLRRFHPGMIEELLHHPALRETPDGQATVWLMFISFFRDDFPWLYEAGMDVYRALRSGDAEQLRFAASNVQRLAEGFFHSHLGFELMGGPEDEEGFMIARHLPEIMQEFLQQVPSPRKRMVRRSGRSQPEEPK